MTDHDSNAHVFVVEDEEDIAALVELNLELAGYRVTIAPNGQVALDRIGTVAPDVVLLDVMMPVLDGWQVLRALKEDPATREIPVVMLTALSDERDLIRGHLQGSVRYVTKPFQMKDLLDVIEDALSPDDADALAARARRTRELLQRLAELDSGRVAAGPRVQFAGLERRHPPVADEPPRPVGNPRMLEELTDQQRHVAEQLARGVGARQIAQQLGVSRSNVYAVRKRVARRLGVRPEEVAEVTRQLLEPP